ncbi:MAG: YeeE/YedE family protein, partial [Granulosicoccus sp.]
ALRETTKTPSAALLFLTRIPTLPANSALLRAFWWSLFEAFEGHTTLGAVARQYRFCTLTALERNWYARNSIGLRAWVLAAEIALVLTQTMLALGLINAEKSFYLYSPLSLLGSIAGGIMFGLGIALVGTCGFGALVRIGGGSLQSLVVTVTIGLVALSTQRGLLGIAREQFIEPMAIDLSSSGNQSLPALLSNLSGIPIYWPTVAACALVLLVWIFKEHQFRTSRAGIISGSLIGICVALGWLCTSQLGDYLYRPVQVESASFVLPPGQLVQVFTLGNSEIADYGVGLIVGVILGSLIVALRQHDARWEACDDARELRRHLGGAFLMGSGGVLAAGCTIGQGVSALSVLAISAPVVFLSMLLGARIGLSWLLEGSPFGWLRGLGKTND